MEIRRATALSLVVLGSLLPLQACSGDEPGSAGGTPVATTTSTATTTATASADQGTEPSTATSDVSVPSTPEATVTAGSSAPESGSASASPEARVSAAGTTTPVPLRKFATATLPASIGGYTGTMDRPGDGTQTGMYTGATEDQMVMITLSPNLEFTTVTKALEGRQTTGTATCGKAAGVPSCFAPLDGGVLWLQGTDRTKPAELAALTNKVHDSFK